MEEGLGPPFFFDIFTEPKNIKRKYYEQTFFNGQSGSSDRWC